MRCILWWGALRSGVGRNSWWGFFRKISQLTTFPSDFFKKISFCRFICQNFWWPFFSHPLKFCQFYIDFPFFPTKNLYLSLPKFWWPFFSHWLTFYQFYIVAIPISKSCYYSFLQCMSKNVFPKTKWGVLTVACRGGCDGPGHPAWGHPMIQFS